MARAARRETRRHRAASEMEVAAEAPDGGDGQGEVELVLGVEPPPLGVTQHAAAECLDVGGGERGVVERDEIAMQADERRPSGAQVEVGGVAFDGLSQQRLDGVHRRAGEQTACQTRRARRARCAVTEWSARATSVKRGGSLRRVGGRDAQHFVERRDAACRQGEPALPKRSHAGRRGRVGRARGRWRRRRWLRAAPSSAGMSW